MMQINEDDNKVNIYHHIGKQQSAVVMLVEDDDHYKAHITKSREYSRQRYKRYRHIEQLQASL